MQTKITIIQLYNSLKPQYPFQIWTILSASLLVISDGMQFGWSSPVIPILESKTSPIKITSDDATWLQTIFLLAGPLILFVTPISVDKIGRHKTILIVACISILGWILIGVATRIEILYCARFLFGMTTNIIFTTVPMYTSEIAAKEIRGLLNGIVYVFFYLGFILIDSIAPSSPFYVPSIVAAGILLLHILTFITMPESPYFLVRQRRYECAMKCLQRLRSKNCDTELEEIRKCMAAAHRKSSIREYISKKSTLKAFLCTTLLFVEQQTCGLAVILMNLYTILEKAGSIYLDSNTTQILFAFLMLVSMFVACLMIDKFGRKNLLVVSGVLTGANLIGLAVYFHLKSLEFRVDCLSWLPLMFVMFYAVTFNIGFGLVPKILVSELFSIRVKAVGMSIGAGTSELAASLSIIFYKYVTQFYEMHFVFYFFGASAFVTVLLTIFVIPETKGKSLEEIQGMLEERLQKIKKLEKEREVILSDNLKTTCVL
nr:PREDICTED: facilitated trehalose transporter Tret1 [Tribolium castaneum]|eukprot:XP_015838643.1 PREDICTED: facilitated trehalose transporter Tret1 [Tribolium castaneum]